MNDAKFWWAILLAGAGLVAKVTVDWYRGEQHERRIGELEQWRQKHSNRFSRLLGSLDEREE